MLNYLKSEFYRGFKNRYLKITVGVFALLEALLVGILYYFVNHTEGFPYGNTKFALSNIYMQMPVLTVVIVFLAYLIDDNEFKNRTIKQSIAFGISRVRIFLGKFIVQAILCCIIYTILVTFFAALSFLALPHSNVGEFSALVRVSVGGLTCLLASLAIAYYFVMNFKSQNIGMTLAMAILFILPVIVNYLGRKVELVNEFAKYMPYNILNYDSILVSGNGDFSAVYGEPLLIGLVWLIAAIVLGLVHFKRKEIR